MKNIESKKLEEQTVLLEEGIDFFIDDLVPWLMRLPSDKITYLTESMGFAFCSWAGLYDPSTKTILAKFVKEL